MQGITNWYRKSRWISTQSIRETRETFWWKKRISVKLTEYFSDWTKISVVTMQEQGILIFYKVKDLQALKI